MKGKNMSLKPVFLSKEDVDLIRDFLLYEACKIDYPSSDPESRYYKFSELGDRLDRVMFDKNMSLKPVFLSKEDVDLIRDLLLSEACKIDYPSSDPESRYYKFSELGGRLDHVMFDKFKSW